MTRKKLSEDELFLAVRIKGAPARRFYVILEAARERGTYARKADLFKELLGLVPAKALTAEEIEYFRTGKKLKK